MTMRRRRGDSNLYLGSGGRLVRPDSESRVLDAAIRKLSRVALVNPDVREVVDDLRQLREQVSSGYHRNPGLLIYGNPPLSVRRVNEGRIIGQIARDVHEIRYQHADDGKAYKHPFEGGVLMFAVERDGQRDLHLTHSDGKPLWEDF